jgi:hypothetical protein
VDRQVKILLGIIVILLAVIALRLWLPGWDGVGRYQMHEGSGGIYLLDTETGRFWVKPASNRDWEDITPEGHSRFPFGGQ